MHLIKDFIGNCSVIQTRVCWRYICISVWSPSVNVVPRIYGEVTHMVDTVLFVSVLSFLRSLVRETYQQTNCFNVEFPA